MSLAALAGVVAALAAAPPPAPPAADVPGARVPIVIDGVGITRGHLRHWTDVAARSQGAGAARADLRLQVVGLLISFGWIRGEAADRGISVSRARRCARASWSCATSTTHAAATSAASCATRGRTGATS